MRKFGRSVMDSPTGRSVGVGAGKEREHVDGYGVARAGEGVIVRARQAAKPTHARAIMCETAWATLSLLVLLILRMHP